MDKYEIAAERNGFTVNGTDWEFGVTQEKVKSCLESKEMQSCRECSAFPCEVRSKLERLHYAIVLRKAAGEVGK